MEAVKEMEVITEAGNVNVMEAGSREYMKDLRDSVRNNVRDSYEIFKPPSPHSRKLPADSKEL